MSNEHCYDRENKNLLVRFSSDGTIEKYVYGNGLIASYGAKPTEETTTTDYRTYIYDIRGSVTEVANVTGNVTAEYRYSTYGNRSIISGMEFDEIGYCARDGVITEMSGLLYMRARYYYPALMRFINEDIVIGDISNSSSLNRYAYVNGNPITLIDPFGLCPEEYSRDEEKLWSSTNYALYLYELGFYSNAFDSDLYSDASHKAIKNFKKVYGLNDKESLETVLLKVREAYMLYNRIITSKNMEKLSKEEINGKKEFKYDDIQKSNFGRVWAFLAVGCDYNLAQISGVMGCINLESRMSSDNANDKKYNNGAAIVHDTGYKYAYKDEIAYGLIQWFAEDRKENLANMASDMGHLPVSDINVQLAQLREDIDYYNNSWMQEIYADRVASAFNYSLIKGGSEYTKSEMARIIFVRFIDFAR